MLPVVEIVVALEVCASRPRGAGESIAVATVFGHGIFHGPAARSSEPRGQYFIVEIEPISMDELRAARSRGLSFAYDRRRASLSGSSLSVFSNALPDMSTTLGHFASLAFSRIAKIDVLIRDSGMDARPRATWTYGGTGLRRQDGSCADANEARPARRRSWRRAVA